MQCIVVKSDEFENSLPLIYIFPLNPDYVAARSLRSLRSNDFKRKRTRTSQNTDTSPAQWLRLRLRLRQRLFTAHYLPTRQTKTETTQAKRSLSEIFYQARVVRAFQMPLAPVGAR